MLPLGMKRRSMKKGNQLMEGYDLPSEQEEAAYESFRSAHFPVLSVLEIIESPDDSPSMALYVLTGRRLNVR